MQKGEALVFGNKGTSNRTAPDETTRDEYEALFREDLLDKANTESNRNEKVLTHPYSQNVGNVTPPGQ